MEFINKDEVIKCVRFDVGLKTLQVLIYYFFKFLQELFLSKPLILAGSY